MNCAQRTTDLTERTADLTEALEQQTATSEVLQVIELARRPAAGVCSHAGEGRSHLRGEFGHVYRSDGDAIQLVAKRNTPPAFAEALKQTRICDPLRQRDVSDGGDQIACTSRRSCGDPEYVKRRCRFIVAALNLEAFGRFSRSPC